MISVKKLLVVPFGVCIMGSVSVEASILDQVVMNVVGQVSNAVGSRLGDEIYYGSSKGARKTTKKRTHKKRRKKAVISQDTPEMQIQKALASLGFYRGKIDGLVNSYETRSAIKAMNIAYNLGNTSSLAPATKDSLIYLGTLFGFDRSLISEGTSKRTKGRKIQTSLKIHGFYFTRIDGAVGKGTRRCIADYKMAKGLSHGSSLDFEEEYQLVSTAKQLNDRNIDDTINALQNTYAQRTAMPQQGQTGQYSQAVNSSYVPDGQMQAPQYTQPHNNMPQGQKPTPPQYNNMPQRQMQAPQYAQQPAPTNQGQIQGSQYPQAKTIQQRQQYIPVDASAQMTQGQVQSIQQKVVVANTAEQMQAPTQVTTSNVSQVEQKVAQNVEIAEVAPAMYTVE